MSELASFIVLGQLEPEHIIGAVAFLIISFIALVLGLVMVVSTWKLFTKAGQPGWAAIVPIYNIVVLLQIVGRPVWWILLLFIPLVNFFVSLILYVDLARVFGKGMEYAVGLILLTAIFLPLLAFGDARYIGPGGQGYSSGMAY